VSSLLVSDLHLGARSGVDLLRQPGVREPLLEAAQEAEDVVLLGDVLELREGPAHEAMAAARPFFEALGAAVGERRVVLVAGNHDHQLIGGWRDHRQTQAAAPPLGLEQRLEPAQASDMAATIAGWLAPARVEVAYPGLWVGPRVYATHGHYLDRHAAVPALETLAVHAAERVMRARRVGLDGVDGYEAVYALIHELAQTASPRSGGDPPDASVSARAYRVLAGGGRGRRPIHHRLLGSVAFPAAVGLLNAAGLGPLRADLSGREMRRSSLRAMAEVVRRLEIQAEHVVFGHSHRTGPLPGDDPGEWLVAGGVRLHNCGSWVVERFLGGPAPEHSPYRAGGAVLVGEDGTPSVRHLLDASRYADALASV
jgi:hypothetical protein